MSAAATITTHIRKRIKQAGIKARVRYIVSCGVTSVQVITPTYGSRFSSDELRQIAHICLCNKLTGARGTPIDPDHYAKIDEREQYDFEVPADRLAYFA